MSPFIYTSVIVVSIIIEVRFSDDHNSNKSSETIFSDIAREKLLNGLIRRMYLIACMICSVLSLHLSPVKHTISFLVLVSSLFYFYSYFGNTLLKASKMYHEHTYSAL